MNQNKKTKKMFVIDSQTITQLSELHSISSNSYSEIVCKAIQMLHESKFPTKGILK